MVVVCVEPSGDDSVVVVVVLSTCANAIEEPRHTASAAAGIMYFVILEKSFSALRGLNRSSAGASCVSSPYSVDERFWIRCCRQGCKLSLGGGTFTGKLPTAI